MNFKKTEDNASFEQRNLQQMKQGDISFDQHVKNSKYEDDLQNQQATTRPLKVQPNTYRQSQECPNANSEAKIQQGFNPQAQNGFTSSRVGKEMQQSESQKLKTEVTNTQSKKSNFANQVQEQYSKISNPVLAEIVSDENETKSFLLMFLVILAFLIEQVAFNEYTQFYEYIMISVFLFFTFGHYVFLYKQQFKYLHYVQFVNSIMVVIIICMWVFDSQSTHQDKINYYIDNIISTTNGNSNSGEGSSPSNSPSGQSIVSGEMDAQSRIYLLLMQTQSKFFYYGAILYRLQECLSKHLIPKYRLLISIISTLAVLILLFQKQYSLDSSLCYDIGIKCLFLILIFAFYEQTQISFLCSYLISFQALKKYFTLSLSSRSCLGFSNNIQIEINPENLANCKVIQGNQQLSELLLNDYMHFFKEFELDPQSITNYNKVDQIEDGDDRALLQEGDFNNFNFGASTEKIKPKSVTGIRQKSRQQSKFSTVSKQFIDKKIMKCSSSDFNKKRNSKMSNPSIVSLKRLSQTEKQDGKDDDQQMTVGPTNTNIGFNKTDYALQTFRNANNNNNNNSSSNNNNIAVNNNILSADIATRNSQLPNTLNSNLNNQNDSQTNPTNCNNNNNYANNSNVNKNSITINSNNNRTSKTKIKSANDNPNILQPKPSQKKIEKLSQKPSLQNQSSDKKDEHIQDIQSIKTNEQSRVLRPNVQSFTRYHTLEDIIKDPNLRSVQVSGRYKKNENSKVQYLSLTLIKYLNLFEKEVVIASITDVTSIQEINNLQREVQFKEIMFANVTHDLRTPLYAIKYSIDKLKEIFQIHQCNTMLEQREQIQTKIKELQDGEVKDLHEQINISIANTHLMEAIIQDIIDNNRNRMGKLEADVRQFNLMEMLQEIEKLMEIILWEKRKKISIKFDICKQIQQNQYIYSDSQRLKQVLMNLISNSIKFTKRGGILIKVSKVFIKSNQNADQYLNTPFKTTLKQRVTDLVDLQNNDQSVNYGNTSLAEKTKAYNENQQYYLQIDNIFQQGLIQFQIIDSGIGMNSKILKNLFTPYNTHNNENMNRHGIGLGLTICKTIVEKLGPFQLKVASKEQRGSKFTFYIYHELQQSMIPSKLEPINIESRKQADISYNQNQLNNFSRQQVLVGVGEEDIHPIASPRSFINLIPHVSEQNLKSEPYLEVEKQEKKTRNQTPPNYQPQKNNTDQIKQVYPHSTLPESERQSSSYYQQDTLRKVIQNQQRGVIANGSIFQFYQQNNDKLITDVQEKDTIKHNFDTIDEKLEDQNQYMEHQGIPMNMINPNESEIIFSKSPKFLTYQYNSSLHYQSMVQHNNPNNLHHANSDSANQNKDTDPIQKSNTLQKFSFGGNSTVIKKNQQNSLDNTASKNNNTFNGSGDINDKDLLGINDILKQKENDWQVQMASSRADFPCNQNQQQTQQQQQQQNNNQHIARVIKEGAEFLNLPILNETQNNISKAQYSTVASFKVGQKAANEKRETDNQNGHQLFNNQVLQVANQITMNRQRINSFNNKSSGQNQSNDQTHIQHIQSPIFYTIGDDYTQKANAISSGKPSQHQMKKFLQDPKHRSYDLKQLKNELMDYQQQAKLNKNQESQEYMYEIESQFQYNPLIPGLSFPSYIINTQSKVTHFKSNSKLQKNLSYTNFEMQKYDQYIDEQCLEEDQLFNSSILLSLEDNQEHINLEESNANHPIKNNNFQVMNGIIKKAINPLESNGNIQKSVRESQLISMDKKGVFISKIDRQNHVTNHKMTESVQLNLIKKIKFGVPNDSDDYQEKEILNILICDDSVFNIKILQRLLFNCKKYKMSIDTCLGGEEAIEKFLKKNKPNSQEPYNYIFLDWNMPIMDGYETSSKIKFYVKDESYLDCPIIICTAYEDTTEINKCLRNGTDGILTKPISQEQVNELLEDFQRSKETFRPLQNG